MEWPGLPYSSRLSSLLPEGRRLACHRRVIAVVPLTRQPADYLFEQLVMFAEDRRGGSEYAPIMQAIATRLSPQQMREAADYYSVR